jgi:predicted O-linked N-acetylglucosamine transferase (SPINDLY family)
MNTLAKAYNYIEIGRFDLANQILLELHLSDSLNTDLLNLLAFIAIKECRWHDALAYFQVIETLGKIDPALYSNIGNLLLELNNITEAIKNFDISLSLNPNYIEAINNKGVALQILGLNDQALLCFTKAIEIDPCQYDAFINIGNLFQDKYLLEDAMINYKKALLLAPKNSSIFNNIGSVYLKLNMLDNALSNFNNAIEIDANCANAFYNRCLTFIEMKLFSEALLDIDRVVQLDSHNPEVFFLKGNIQKELFLIQQAKDSYFKSFSLNRNLKSKIALIFLNSLPIYSDKVDHYKIRSDIINELKELQININFNYFKDITNIHLDIGLSPPFYLSYQEVNNKELLVENAKIYSLVMKSLNKKFLLPKYHINVSKKIKIGIIGEQIRDHAVYATITSGIIEEINKNIFEIYIFHLGKNKDSQTFESIKHIHKYTDNKNSLVDWCNSIFECNLDVIFYPEIGMDTLTIQLASLRIAPIQMVSWGHPETTGLESIDYFLSAELFEPSESHTFYSEKLVKLSNLGCYYKKLNVLPTKPTLDFTIMEGPILLCPGTLYKYNQNDDDIFIQIIRTLKKCKFIFFDQRPYWTNQFKLRLKRLFEFNNLDMDEYVIFLPWMKPSDFFWVLKYSTVYLDSIGFSGFNTAMQAIECTTPIVAYEGLFLRGRLASGILRRLNLDELIANTKEEYVRLVVKIATDYSYRQKIIDLIRKNKDILFDDLQPIRDLESLFLDLCRPQT